MGSILENFLGTSEELEEDTLLHFKVAFNGRCNRATKDVEEGIVFAMLLCYTSDILNVGLGQIWLLFFSE